MGARSPGRKRPVLRRAPVPELPSRSAPHLVYGLAVLDRYGRLAERALLLALGWAPSLTVRLTVVTGSVVVKPDAGGPSKIGADLYLRLPVGVRRACRLVAGDRVLLVADPFADRLVLHPPVALDALLAAHHAAVSAGATR